MPRVTQRKARKDYPNQGIKKGDLYYYTSLKLQRGGMVKRSLTPFKPSQLTNSPFKSGWLATQKAWEAGDRDGEAMRAAAESFREIANECQEGFDNMPEGLQQGDTGQMLENRAQEGERIADELESCADEFEALEEPEAVDAPDDDEAEDFLEKTDAYETYQDELQEFESQKDAIRDEADGLAGEMPE